MKTLSRQPGPALTVLMVTSLLQGGMTTAMADAQQNDEANRTLTIELKNTITLEARLGGCEAKLALEYLQKGDLAEVEIEIDNTECAASYGDFTVHVRYRHESGEMHTAEFPETWSRDDGQPVRLSRLYPIGDDVDLVRVRSRGLSCTCGVMATEQEEP